MNYVLCITLFNNGEELIHFIFSSLMNGMLYANATRKLMNAPTDCRQNRSGRAALCEPIRKNHDHATAMPWGCCEQPPSPGIRRNPRRTIGHPHSVGSLTIMALTAIGLSANLRKMASTGPRPVLLGLGVRSAVAVSSMLVQREIAESARGREPRTLILQPLRERHLVRRPSRMHQD